jgi:hypothetical protein
LAEALTLRKRDTPPNQPLKQTAAPRRDHAASLSPVVKYHGLARCHLTPPRFLMRPLLNGGTLDRQEIARLEASRSLGSSGTHPVALRRLVYTLADWQ